MKFDWDSKKAEANRRKHGVSFDEAATVFLDPHAVSGPDPDHSAEEKRYITFGCSKLGRYWQSATLTGRVRCELSVHAA